MGDFIGRNNLWTDTNPNQKGNFFSDFITSENNGILNIGEPTHSDVQSGTLSFVHILMCSYDAITDFSCRMGDDRHTNDHFPVVTDPTVCHYRGCQDEMLIKLTGFFFYKLKFIDVMEGEFPI